MSSTTSKAGDSGRGWGADYGRISVRTGDYQCDMDNAVGRDSRRFGISRAVVWPLLLDLLIVSTHFVDLSPARQAPALFDKMNTLLILLGFLICIILAFALIGLSASLAMRLDWEQPSRLVLAFITPFVAFAIIGTGLYLCGAFPK